jgi:Protein of unknown function (DUF3987)
MTIRADHDREITQRLAATAQLDRAMSDDWELQDALQELKAKLPTAHNWPKPTPLPDGLPPVAAFDYELLPTLCRDFVADIAERMQCPPDFVAVAVMVSLSSLVGRRCCIAPKRADDWRVTPNLWGMVVSRPGTMKSPALKEAMSPLSVLSVRALNEFDNSQREMQAQSFLHEQLVNVTRDKMRRALKDGKRGEASELAQHAIAIESGAATCRRYIVNDCTVEKLGELLNENPNGLLCFRDELNGFFANLEKQGREADRAFYLECWNGDSPFTYDRIGRGTVHIAAACLSILGGIQPAPLAGILRGTNGAGDDGLLQRFQLAVWPDTGKDWHNIDRPPNEQARERMQRLAEQLDVMPMAGDGQVLRFSDEAQSLFDVWREILELRLRSEAEHPTLVAHLSKYRKLVPALALLIHVTEQPNGPVQLLALERAIAWAEYLETHARRIYSPAIAPDMDAALLLAKRINKGEIGARFTLRDIYRSGWSGLSTRELAFAAVNVLLDFDWLRTTEETTSGRTRTAYEINPALLEAGQ